MLPAPAALPRWISRFVATRDGVPPSSSLMPSRIEVCPPELWPSSLGWRATLRRWVQRRLPAAARPANRLAQVKREFLGAAVDIPAPLLDGLDQRIARARSLREFWHLRSPLYNALAMGLNQIEAERRLMQLNRHFPTRTPRGMLAA